MIEKITYFQKLNDFNSQSIYTIRIKSLAVSYGFSYSFASFYRQLINGVCTAILSKLDSDITLAVDTQAADLRELSEFLEIQCFSSLLCADDFQLAREYERGTVMASFKKNDVKPEFDICVLESYSDLYELYDFIGYEGRFELWYTDIRRRISKATVKACAVRENSKIVSSALLSSVYEENAVLTGVKTDINFRKKGYAGALVDYLCRGVKGTVFLMREYGKNEDFYHRLGFKNIDKWRMYK